MLRGSHGTFQSAVQVRVYRLVWVCLWGEGPAVMEGGLPSLY